MRHEEKMFFIWWFHHLFVFLPTKRMKDLLKEKGMTI